MDNKEKLYIPYGVGIEREIITGFGKKQIQHFLIGIFATVLLAIILFAITQSLAALAITAVVGLSADYMLTRKEVYSQSVVGFLGNLFAFSKNQQKFDYKYDRNFEILWKEK